MATTLQDYEQSLKIIGPIILSIIVAVTAIWASKHFRFIFKYTKTRKSDKVEENRTIEIGIKYEE